MERGGVSVAQEVPEFPKSNGRGRTEKYPFDAWFDGKVYKLLPGEDFACSAASLNGAIRKAAERRGIEVKVATRGEEVYVQALKNQKVVKMPRRKGGRKG